MSEQKNSKPQKPPRPAKASRTAAPNSRLVALEILRTVLRQKQAFDETLDRHEALRALDPRDRGFVHLLVATCLRRLGQIDDMVKTCLDKPNELKAVAQDLLRLGAAQILFLQTPSHAAVDTIVELAGQDNATAPYKGLINAVLRRLTREGADLLKKQDAVKLNIPDWLWLSWRKAYGVGAARAIAEACLGEALNDVTVKSDPSSWTEKLGARLLPNGSLRLSGTTPIPELFGFKEGAWWIQDAAAAMPPLLMGEIKGQRVADLCAAPGGKTAQLAAMGGLITAADRSAPRLARLKENLSRLHLEAEVVCKDAADFAPNVKFPFVLLDAPCSATGTIRRHPDVLRLKTAEDVSRLADLQKRLLDRAIGRILAVGGTLVYSVCSLQPEEGEAQIEACLERHPKLKRKPIRAEEIGGCAEFLTPQGDLRCLPSQWEEWGGIDGFFAARLTLAN
jgi:16S rRNA (cytosine967-C5)-methyltransferase